MNWYRLSKQAEKLKDVKLVGKLKQTKDGFTYLDIPDNVITALFALIDKDGIVKPPPYSTGAHISVMDDKEVQDIDIKELGQEFNFTMGEMKSTKPEGWEEVDRVYFVQVYSEELEKLRKKYGLSKKLKGHEFHITIAIEKA